MSYKIDPREVLEYLNGLGYTNITAHQLKEFIIDLKKLIKYDTRFGDEKENSTLNSYYAEESGYCECSETSDFSASGLDDKENINGVNIPSEKPKQKSILKEASKNKHISLHIYESKPRKNVLHEHCVHVSQDNNKSNSQKCDSVISKEKDFTTVSTIQSIRPQSSSGTKSRSDRSSKDKKSKTVLIRPCSAKPSFNKSDPVALYHFYQSVWKRSKIPGQDKREDLRWAVRERMLSGPKVELKNRPIIRSCSSCR
ncbi:hyls1 centriolar and ciliogenesis associated [Rhynchophorus ferrugineus]|uniref:Centriolar and ciliogenesis-associated protein HYLS1 C-terminal domain-containing protein n=1 Tax=Rhynchophorus ferrugineus TaxID=354439 RepID=A0A834MNE1_RHYFE|nr:hypothetical protein GWI33_001700 [Rhynchophorus ferrugineus]